MSRRLKPAVSARLDDPEAERIRRNHDERITELQGLLMTEARVINDVSLPDSTDVPISHGLGRKPKMVVVSPPRNAAGGPSSTGRIVERRLASSGYDRASVVVLRATGHGATITVDLLVI